jgi:hypothetical protein
MGSKRFKFGILETKSKMDEGSILTTPEIYLYSRATWCAGLAVLCVTLSRLSFFAFSLLLDASGVQTSRQRKIKRLQNTSR